MIPSDEQQKIIHHISMGRNVSVNAVAGSGKSTTVIMTAQRLPEMRFLQITYNSLLRKDVQEKVASSTTPLTNIEVHTYHSLAVKYYSRTAWTDIDLQHVVFKDSPALSGSLPLYNIIVLDEIQDMTLLYFSFIVKFLKDICLQNPEHRFQMVVMGDVMQGLYDFKGADTRFLTHASEIWAGFPYFRDLSPFVECTLRISYRITTPIAAFVNKVMLGEELLVANKPGCPVHYVRNDLPNLAVRVCYIIRGLIRDGTRPEDIFILAGSVRSSNISTTKLENLLVMHGIPCYVPRDQQNNLDSRVIQKKIVFSTFHAVKGRQRPHVFVLEYDNSYFDYLGKAYPSNRCPNTLYVACTRACESLYLFEKSGQTDRPMDFHKMGHYEMKQQDWINFEGMHQSVFWTLKPPKEGKIKTHLVKPTDLIKFMGETVVNWSSAFVERVFRQLHKETDIINIPTLVETPAGFWEDVSDLNGIAIPPIFFSRLMGGENQSALFYKIVGDLLAEKNRRKEHAFLSEIYDKQMPQECRTIADWLFSANIYSAVSDGLYSKLKQLGDCYTWLTESDMEKCAERMNAVVCQGSAEGLRVEVVIAEPASEEHTMAVGRVLNPAVVQEILGENAPPTRFLFSARVDLITQNELWELKCTSELVLEHFLQLAIYAWLWQVIYSEPKKFRLFNIRTGEHYLLDASFDELTEMMVVLLKGKYCDSIQKTNEDFFTDVHGVLRQHGIKPINSIPA